MVAVRCLPSLKDVQVKKCLQASKIRSCFFKTQIEQWPVVSIGHNSLKYPLYIFKERNRNTGSFWKRDFFHLECLWTFGRGLQRWNGLSEIYFSDFKIIHWSSNISFLRMSRITLQKRVVILFLKHTNS